VFAWVGKQLSAVVELELLELLDDVLDEELAELVLLEELDELTLLDELTELDELELTLLEELEELTLLEELTELTLLDELTELEELEDTDEELTELTLLDETLLLEEPVAVAVVGSLAEPPLHAAMNKLRLLTRLARRKRVRVFMIPLPRCSSIANNKILSVTIRFDVSPRSVLNIRIRAAVNFLRAYIIGRDYVQPERREMLTGHADDLRDFVRPRLSSRD
jgi:hypothetical protein